MPSIFDTISNQRGGQEKSATWYRNAVASIADKENVKYDTDALHVIAEKADGALRDALSCFDLMVNFCETLKSGKQLCSFSITNSKGIKWFLNEYIKYLFQFY